MNGRLRLALGLVAALVALYFGYQIYRAGDDDVDLPPHGSSQITFDSGKAFGRRIGSRSWSVDYDRIVADNNQTVLELYGIKNGIVFRAGKPYLRIAAQHATVNTLSHDFFVNGHVHVETIGERPARSFDTATAQWSDATQTVTMPQKIAIHSGSDQPLLVGSLSYDVKTGDIDLTGVAGPARAR